MICWNNWILQSLLGVIMHCSWEKHWEIISNQSQNGQKKKEVLRVLIWLPSTYCTLIHNPPWIKSWSYAAPLELAQPLQAILQDLSCSFLSYQLDSLAQCQALSRLQLLLGSRSSKLQKNQLAHDSIPYPLEKPGLRRWEQLATNILWYIIDVASSDNEGAGSQSNDHSRVKPWECGDSKIAPESIIPLEESRRVCRDYHIVKLEFFLENSAAQ